MPRTPEERAAKMAQIRAETSLPSSLEDRVIKIEEFLKTLGYEVIEEEDLLPKLAQNAALHGHLIGEFDLDQVRQDAHRQNDRKLITKNGKNIKALKSTQDQILKEVNK